MSRIARPTKPGLLTRLIYRATRREFGRMLEPVEIQARVPGLLFGYAAMEYVASRSHLVDHRLQELAGLKAATVVGCQFCIDIGSHLAGLNAAELQALANHGESDLFTRAEKLVLDYAEAMSRTPILVEDQLWSALREEFDEPMLVELTTLIALENYRARFNWALEIPAAGFTKGRACAVAI